MKPTKGLLSKLRILARAEKDVIEELRKAYPMGLRVGCILMSGQIHPSRGNVIGYEGGTFGLVKIRLESRTNEVRSVAAEDIRIITYGN